MLVVIDLLKSVGPGLVLVGGILLAWQLIEMRRRQKVAGRE